MIFITGATGLVGSNLLMELASLEEIVCLKRKSTSKDKCLDFLRYYKKESTEHLNKITWVDGDLRDVNSYIAYLNKETYVYHCAAMVSFNPQMEGEMHDVNVNGTAQLVDACLEKNVKKLAFVSSVAAIGNKSNGEFINENSPWSEENKSGYSLSKYFAEMEVWRGIAEGLNAVIVNPSVILGAGNWNEGSPKLIHFIAQGQRFFTRGITGYVDVRDVSKALVLLMNSDICGERFVLSSANLSYKDFFERVATLLKSRIPTKEAKPWMTEVAWRLAKLTALILGKQPALTVHTARTSHKENKYDGGLISEKIKFKYTDIQESLDFICKCYKLDHKKKMTSK